MANSITVRHRRNVLTDADMRMMHSAALEILERTGVAVRSEKAQLMLQKAGCDVDRKSAVVKFPEGVVEECVRKANRAVTFYGRTRKHDARLDGHHTYVTSDGNGTMAMDFETRQRRESRKSDVAKSAFVADALKGHGVNWPNVTSRTSPRARGTYTTSRRPWRTRRSTSRSPRTPRPGRSRMSSSSRPPRRAAGRS